MTHHATQSERLDERTVVVKPKRVSETSWWIGLSREAFDDEVARRFAQSEQPTHVFNSKGLFLNEVMP